MGHRRKSREYALQGLYIYESGNSSLDDIIKFEWVDNEIPVEIRDFSLTLIKGTVDNIDLIDNLVKKYSKNWSFERISTVDKSILRISIYELLFLKDIPSVVTINESIELGKIYGGETSGQYINGILDAINRLEKPAEA